VRIGFWTFLLEMRACSSWMRNCPADPWRVFCRVFGVVWFVTLRRMVWLFSEGFASFSVSFEVCAYAVLDICSKAIFGFMVMAAHDQLGAASASSQEYV